MIAVGDRIPNVTVRYLDNGDLKEVSTEELFQGKRVVLFSLPGAFTPTCSARHLPGFVAKADEIKAKGISLVACMAVNDAFVMDAWGKSMGVDGKIMMLSDGNAEFAKATGTDLDLAARGFGVRSSRYSMVVDDCVVKVFNCEPVARELTCSAAENILSQL